MKAQGISPATEVGVFTAVPGRGLRGKTTRSDLVIGTEELVGSEVAVRWGMAEPDTIRIYALASEGRSGVVTLRDEIRPSAPRVIERLHRLGIRPIVMLTGDSAAAAQLVARQTGVDAVRWRRRPEQKVEAVRELRAQHGTVAKSRSP